MDDYRSPQTRHWREEIQNELKAADYHRISKSIKDECDAAGAGDLKPLKIAFLSSYSIQFVEPFVMVEGARARLAVKSFFGEFGQLEQELLDSRSRLYQFKPDVLVLAFRIDDLDPDAIVRYNATNGRRFKEIAAQLCERLRQSVEAFSSHLAVPVLMANFAMPYQRPLGVFDAHTPNSLTCAVHTANAALRETAATFPNAFVWDYAGLVAAHGSAKWCDPRLWAMGRIAVAGIHQPHVAGHLIRTICGVLWPPAKCIALDLDNTLWGGVIGDDGMAGIRLGDDYPGNAFKTFQRSLLALMDRGILLAIVSKNDAPVAKEVFDNHPEMLIKWEHLSATRINWEPKSRNIRALAEELNIGADAIVLVDDNPVERAEVRSNAPEVLVLDLPADPLGFPAALADCPYFDQTTVSEEDRVRGEMYRQQTARKKFEEHAESVENFLNGLEMTAAVGQADGATLGRISQLVSKTNQFNLTTRRHSQSEIACLAENQDSAVLWLRLKDRFGDQGLVCVGILKKAGRSCIIDTFIMSCRVMNRQVEHAFMAYLFEHARLLGCDQIIGEYIPTAKNKMVSGIYKELGFTPAMSDDAFSRFTLDLEAVRLEWPNFIKRA
ncbi:MAG: HAD-IIIC family phosphatase [Desulfobacteraceae bacterium]|nr:MAG: HAD-IIIC family phosphatase [Desulfobacteraceae bacterium]